MNESPPLRAARDLLALGLPRSALAILQAAEGWGPELDGLRRKAARRVGQPCPPGIYFPATFAAQAVLLLAQPEPVGAWSTTLDTAARQAVDLAARLVRDLPGLAGVALPDLRLTFPPSFSVEGESLGLAAALAALLRWTGRRPTRPIIIASAALDAAGRVRAVGGMSAKFRAARAELDGLDGLVLVAAEQPPEEIAGLSVRPVQSLAEAAALAAGAGPYEPDRAFLSLDAQLRRIAAENDHRRALRALEAIELAGLAPADAARVLFEQSLRQRHLGQTIEAVRLHGLCRERFGDAARLLGQQVVETWDVESLATELDGFDLRPLEAELRQRLEGRFEIVHNQVRVRGMLAQLLASTDRAQEALPLRDANLEVQQQQESMRQELPRTLCYLTLEAGLARDHSAFEQAARRLLEATRPGETVQMIFNEAALVRGLVLLDRCAEALAWARGAQLLFGRFHAAVAPAILTGPESIEGHPRPSLARALARALRRTGERTLARDLVRRVTTHDPDAGLVAWVALLAHVEGALACLELGDTDQANNRLRTLAGRLRASHVAASRFHERLLLALEAGPGGPAEIAAIEQRLDLVYY